MGGLRAFMAGSDAAGASGNVCTTSAAAARVRCRRSCCRRRAAEADLPRAVIRVQFPGRTSQGEQRIAQGHGTEVQCTAGSGSAYSSITACAVWHRLPLRLEHMP